MQFKFSHNIEELVDLYVFNAWSAPWKKKTRQRLGLFIPLAFGLLAIAMLLQDGHWLLGAIYLLLAVLWLIFYNNLYTRRLKIFAKGYYNHQVNERFWAEHHYGFKDNHIELKNELVEAKIQWKAIINVIERDDAFWLFETLAAAHIIPKRIMSQQEQQQFKQLMASKLVQS